MGVTSDIEHARIDQDGKRWSTTLQHHYGYLKGTRSAEGDHVDVFIKPTVGQGSAGQVYVIDQMNPKTGESDERKVMMGFGSQQEAEAAYKANFQPG